MLLLEPVKYFNNLIDMAAALSTEFYINSKITRNLLYKNFKLAV